MSAPWIDDAIARADALMERLPHGLLVHGPGGWGEAQVAAAVASRLLNLDGRAVKDVAHPDLRWLEPEDGTIRIDAIRALIGFLQQTPRLAPCKAAVIVDAERMNPNAANALLKSLEEPPPDSFAVLVSSAPERLLPTVRSRCQNLPVYPAPRAQVRDWLQQQGVESDALPHLMIEFGNAPLAVRDAARGEVAPLWPRLAIAGKTPAQALEVAETLSSEDLVELSARWLRILGRLTRRLAAQDAASPRLARVMDFAAEVQRLRAAALFNKSLSRPMQLERLCLLWAALWREAALDRI